MWTWTSPKIENNKLKIEKNKTKKNQFKDFDYILEITLVFLINVNKFQLKIFFNYRF